MLAISRSYRLPLRHSQLDDSSIRSRSDCGCCSSSTACQSERSIQGWTSGRTESLACSRSSCWRRVAIGLRSTRSETDSFRGFFQVSTRLKEVVVEEVSYRESHSPCCSLLELQLILVPFYSNGGVQVLRNNQRSVDPATSFGSVANGTAPAVAIESPAAPQQPTTHQQRLGQTLGIRGGSHPLRGGPAFGRGGFGAPPHFAQHQQQQPPIVPQGFGNHVGVVGGHRGGMSAGASAVQVQNANGQSGVGIPPPASLTNQRGGRGGGPRGGFRGGRGGVRGGGAAMMNGQAHVPKKPVESSDV